MLDLMRVLVDIPALDKAAGALSDLLAYLRERNNQQARIDALALTVANLTKQLKDSASNLSGAITSVKV